MAELKNTILEKLVEEGKISHPPAEESYQIWKHTHERMIKYSRLLIKRTFASYKIARNLIYNS